MLIDNPLRAVRISQQILITRTTRWQRRLSLSVAWYTMCYDVQGQPDNLFEELVFIVGNTLFATCSSTLSVSEGTCSLVVRENFASVSR